MTINTCQEDRDCRDPVRSKCMGTLLRETYGKAELITDQTYCLQADCRAHRTACSPGETCMSDVLPASSRPPDICVPNCDANGNCPPNYFCYSSVYSKKLPPICIPGLLGLRCNSNLDCLFGECVKSDAGFKSCSVRCENDVDCARFDSVHATLFCNADGWCAGVRATRGTQCDADARLPLSRARSARASPTCCRKGQCLQPCPSRRCPAYGGVPHACRPQVDATGALASPDLALGLLARLPRAALLRQRGLPAGPGLPSARARQARPGSAPRPVAATATAPPTASARRAGATWPAASAGRPCSRATPASAPASANPAAALGPASEKRCAPLVGY